MSHRQNPPRQSPAQRARKLVCQHANESSVGHNFGTRKRKAIRDPRNGNAQYGAGQAPGDADGDLLDQGDYLPSTW